MNIDNEPRIAEDLACASYESVKNNLQAFDFDPKLRAMIWRRWFGLALRAELQRLLSFFRWR